jgi:hypothetical protein
VFDTLATGNVYFADDVKHCTEVVNIGAPVNVMYYSHGKPAAGAAAGANPMAAAGSEPGYLVLVSGDASLYKYKIAADGKVSVDSVYYRPVNCTDYNVMCCGCFLCVQMSQERKVKLSIKGDGSELQCVWAGSGLLAAANNEPMLRLWHQEKDLNYVLTLNGMYCN